MNKHKGRENITYWYGLVIILIWYTVYNLWLGDNAAAYNMPRHWRHIARFGTVLAVYATGTWGLGKLRQQWLLQLWHLVHTTLIICLLLLGAWDWAINALSFPMRRLGNSIHEFLTSPLLYLSTGLLGRLVDRES